MCVPPARIVATNEQILRPGRAPPTLPTRRTVALTSASKPRRTINVAGSTSPAFATNVSSSKVASRRSIACNTDVTGSASRSWLECGVEHHNRPKTRGTFRGYATLAAVTHRWIEAKSWLR